MSTAFQVSASALSPGLSLDEEEESQVLSCAHASVPIDTLNGNIN